MAVAFVSDQRLYNSVYQEKYTGLPAENEYGYRERSPMHRAGKLEGDLLIFYGISERGNTPCHLHRVMERSWLEHLPPGPR